VPLLLADTALFVHGSTVATNTVLERSGARIGMLVTAGFRDALEIRRGLRDNPWDHRVPYPPVLVPRFLRRPVTERIDRHGDESHALTIADIASAAAEFKRENVDAVVISFFNSYMNSSHEDEAATELARHWPGAWVTRSAAIAPVMGEYERTSTAVLNAYITPRTVTYLQNLNRRLRELGLTRPMLLIQSNGGAISVDQVAERPVTLLLSGPAAGVGALDYYSRAIGSDDLISMEIGGTSCDVLLMSGGNIAFTDMLSIGGYHPRPDGCPHAGRQGQRMKTDRTLDPIQLALVQARLDHIARQMGHVMIRTSRSPIFNQSHDFSCFITDAAGTLVSQADGIPIHTGGGGFAVRALLKAFTGNIARNDAFLLNDPYAAGGNHLPDWVIARPVFAADRLVAFACNRAHQSDIGGGAAGTYNPQATEIFHEGIRLPALKLIEGSVTREDLWQLLLLNSRLPELLDGSKCGRLAAAAGAIRA